MRFLYSVVENGYLSSPRVHLFDKKYKTNSTIMIYYNLENRFYFNIFYIYSCDSKLNCQYNYSSLWRHMILQKSF